MTLIIAIPRESRPTERRVALDPSRVERLINQGFQVRIEADCGHNASFHDEAYPSQVEIADSFAEVVADADIVVKVVCPTLEEIALLPERVVLVCIMSAFQHLDEIVALRTRHITVLAMDHLPRTTRAQPMDALSSQATVAGYKAALLAAELSPRLFPMLTTAAGTIRPSRVLVIGAGVAGLQAIATSKRLGAQVDAYDVRKAAKEQIESVGARMIETGVEVEGAGGFARALRQDEKQKQHDVLAGHLAKAHVVITAASIPGRAAPTIITEDMVDGMLPESVIVDLAASTGGNCELTKIGEHHYHNDTLIVGPLNLPSHGAVHASEMYSRNVYNMLELIMSDGSLKLDPSDEIIAKCVLLHAGNVHHANTAKLLDVPDVSFGATIPVAKELPDDTAGWLQAESEIELHAATVHTDSHSPADMRITESKPAGEVLDDMASDDDQIQLALSRIEDTEFLPQGEEILEDVDDISELVLMDGAQLGDVEEEAVSDDLTLIDGVGPALQGRLIAFGYRRFEQLAVLDADSIEKLSVQLELSDEIKQQDWAGQARQLMESQQ